MRRRIFFEICLHPLPLSPSSACLGASSTSPAGGGPHGSLKLIGEATKGSSALQGGTNYFGVGLADQQLTAKGVPTFVDSLCEHILSERVVQHNGLFAEQANTTELEVSPRIASRFRRAKRIEIPPSLKPLHPLILCAVTDVHDKAEA